MIPAQIYVYVYTLVLGFVALLYYNKLTGRSAIYLIEKHITNKSSVAILFVIIALFIGERPISGIFTDMLGYSDMYDANILTDHNDIGIWWLASICNEFGFGSSVWFTLISFIYFGAYLKASNNISSNSSALIFITFLTAFSTFSYATNTIRSGMSTSLAAVGISYYILEGRKNKFIACLLFLGSILTHKSSTLPIVCFIVSYYKVNFKMSMYFWLLSILISLTVGNALSTIFENLGFDDRMDQYLQATDMTGFAHVGFRWDFLLYSMMPILLAFYIIIKRGIRDKIYETLISTYVLANAFWVMIIRAQFSDRFAYLSWFLYPIVLVYPLLRLDVWGISQGNIAKKILWCHLGFTLFMVFIFYA